MLLVVIRVVMEVVVGIKLFRVVKSGPLVGKLLDRVVEVGFGWLLTEGEFNRIYRISYPPK